MGDEVLAAPGGVALFYLIVSHFVSIPAVLVKPLDVVAAILLLMSLPFLVSMLPLTLLFTLYPFYAVYDIVRSLGGSHE